MSKIDVFQKFDDLEMKRMQIVYLNDYGFNVDEIAKWSDYAKSTIKNYIRKFADLLDKAKKTFYRITQKAKKVLIGGKQLVYLFKFYNASGELVFSKVGTTTQLPEKRMSQEMREYKKSGLPVESATMNVVIDCGALPAEGAESAVRAYYIKRFPDAFRKNDRFFGVDIPERSFVYAVNTYLTEKA